jgi:putative sigma-54 modulation protein
MELMIRNAEGTFPEREREYASKKLSRLQRYFNKATRVELVHSEQKGRHKIEVTVFADEFRIRGEEQEETVRACIDKVTELLENRLRRLKTRLVDLHRRRGTRELPAALQEGPTEEGEASKIVERKKFPAKPMSAEEAALEMELLGHPFFAFHNADTGKFAVIYRRRDGHYGLLEPES